MGSIPRLHIDQPVTHHSIPSFSGVVSFGNEGLHETDIKQARPDSHHPDRHIHGKDIMQMPPDVNEIPALDIETSFPNKDRRLQRSNKPLCTQLATDDHKDAVLDVSKLTAESQSVNSNSSTHEVVKASELYTPRSALSRRRSQNTSGYQDELCKKVSFGSSASLPGMVSASPSQEQHQTPLYNHQQQSPKQHSKKNDFLQETQSSSREISNGADLVRCGAEPEQADYALFRTRSLKERQLSRLQSRQQREQQKGQTDDGHGRNQRSLSDGSMPAGRYFDALKGPELEILKDSEEVLLPLDKVWPFLLRFPIGCFGICLGLASQAVLWKVLATSPSMTFLHVHLAVNFALWCLALTALAIIFTTYAFKCLLYFEAVRREFHHPVRVNFFFAPWIVCMFLAMGTPPRITTSIHPSLWCVFTTPLLILELKIYGQWLSGGQRRLSRVANPSTHLSLVGNFVAALFAAQLEWKEPAIFFWAVGCAHYLVLFVTLYQRLPTAETLPKELHPVFFLFVAAPSTASVAWKYIVGEFDNVSRIAYFTALFLYASLVVRVKFFCGFRFSIAWWAYTFPMTASAIATVHYSIEVRNPFTQVLAIILSMIATITVLTVLISTILHVMWGNLFPNDIAIAITPRRHGRRQK